MAELQIAAYRNLSTGASYLMVGAAMHFIPYENKANADTWQSLSAPEPIKGEISDVVAEFAKPAVLRRIEFPKGDNFYVGSVDKDSVSTEMIIHMKPGYEKQLLVYASRMIQK